MLTSQRSGRYAYTIGMNAEVIVDGQLMLENNYVHVLIINHPWQHIHPPIVFFLFYIFLLDSS